MRRYVKFFCVTLLAMSAGLAQAASPLCASSGNIQSYEWVSRVSINGVNVSVPTTGYHDATGSSLGTLTAGQTYPIQVDVQTDGTSYQEYVKFWFDLNQNGSIEDGAVNTYTTTGSELVYDQNSTFATFQTFSGTVTIPANAYNGQIYVRMIMQYAANPSLCGSYTYGTTVDLLVNVTGGINNPTNRSSTIIDSSVAGTVSAQAFTAQNFAEIQIRNVTNHFDQLYRDFRTTDRFSFSLNNPLGSIANNAQENSQNQEQSGAAYSTSANAPSANQDRKDTRNPSENRSKDSKGEASQIIPLSPEDKKYAFWGSGIIDYGNYNLGQSRNKFNTKGITFGLDFMLTNNLIGGIAVGYGDDDSKIDSFGTKVGSNQKSGILYGVYKSDSNLYLDGLVGYSDLSFRNDRYSQGAGTIFSSDRNGRNVFASFGLSKYFNLQSFSIKPYGRVNLIKSDLNGYTETGGIYALNFGSLDTFSKTAIGGLSLEKDYSFDSGIVTVVGLIETRYNSEISVNQSVNYADTPDQVEVYSFKSLPTNMQSVGLGVMYKNKKGVSSGLNWKYSDGTNSYSANTIKLNFSLPF